MTVSTEGRIFVAQMIRDLRKRERTGAGLLAPGATKWADAFHAFVLSVHAKKSPTKAGQVFASAAQRLVEATKQRACWVNFFHNRKRSGIFQVLTYEVSPHPLTRSGYEGILVRSWECILTRRGRAVGVNREGTKLAFISWHALARMRERSSFDLLSANGVVGFCGIVGLLMLESAKHFGTGINFAVCDENNAMLCTGVLRYDAKEQDGFFDVVTVLPPPDDDRYKEMWYQGLDIAAAANTFVKGDNADPAGYGDRIAVLPFRDFDFVSRQLQLKAAASRPGASGAS